MVGIAYPIGDVRCRESTYLNKRVQGSRSLVRTPVCSSTMRTLIPCAPTIRTPCRSVLPALGRVVSNAWDARTDPARDPLIRDALVPGRLPATEAGRVRSLECAGVLALCINLVIPARSMISRVRKLTDGWTGSRARHADPFDAMTDSAARMTGTKIQLCGHC